MALPFTYMAGTVPALNTFTLMRCLPAGIVTRDGIFSKPFSFMPENIISFHIYIDSLSGFLSKQYHVPCEKSIEYH